MLLKTAYLLVRRILGVAVLISRSDLAKDAELLMLRHENAVLRRHAGRVRHDPADRVWLAALARLIPRRRWAEIFPIRPATLLAWHGRLTAGTYDMRQRRTRGRPPTVRRIACLVVRLAKESALWGHRAGSTANWRSSGRPWPIGHATGTYGSGGRRCDLANLCRRPGCA